MSSNPNVILVVLDSVSANRLSCYGYDRPTTPNLDEFAARSVRYENALANASWTVPAHGTLFTGLHPSEHGAHARHKRLPIRGERTLAGRLSENGYQTVGLSTNPWIATEFDYDSGFDEFEDVKVPLPFEGNRPDELYQRIRDGEYQGLRKYLEAARWAFDGNPLKRVVNSAYDRRHQDYYADADVLNNRVSRWLDVLENRPFFMFLNYMDAHEPYNPSREYLTRFRADDCDVDVSWHLRSLNEEYTAAEKDCINDRYDACLSYLDERIGQLLEELESRDLFEETLIIVTSDHGKCLGEHEYMGVGTFLYDELVQVPLLISPATETEPGVERELVSHIDVHDMILRAIGTDELESAPGVISETMGPHQDVDVNDRELPESGLRRVNYDGNVMIRDVGTGEITRPDSSEFEGRAQLERIEEKFLQERQEASRTAEATEMDADVENQLQQLGYL